MHFKHISSPNTHPLRPFIQATGAPSIKNPVCLSVLLASILTTIIAFLAQIPGASAAQVICIGEQHNPSAGIPGHRINISPEHYWKLPDVSGVSEGDWAKSYAQALNETLAITGAAPIKWVAAERAFTGFFNTESGDQVATSLPLRRTVFDTKKPPRAAMLRSLTDTLATLETPKTMRTIDGMSEVSNVVAPLVFKIEKNLSFDYAKKTVLYWFAHIQVMNLRNDQYCDSIATLSSKLSPSEVMATVGGVGHLATSPLSRLAGEHALNCCSHTVTPIQTITSDWSARWDSGVLASVYRFVREVGLSSAASEWKLTFDHHKTDLVETLLRGVSPQFKKEAKADISSILRDIKSNGHHFFSTVSAGLTAEDLTSSQKFKTAFKKITDPKSARSDL